MKKLDEFTNVIIDLIDFNEDLLKTRTYDQLVAKTDRALELYDRYDATVDDYDLTEEQQLTLSLLQGQLNHTNNQVKRLLEVRLVNNNIKERILAERKKSQ